MRCCCCSLPYRRSLAWLSAVMRRQREACSDRQGQYHREPPGASGAINTAVAALDSRRQAKGRPCRTHPVLGAQSSSPTHAVRVSSLTAGGMLLTSKHHPVRQTVCGSLGFQERALQQSAFVGLATL